MYKYNVKVEPEIGESPQTSRRIQRPNIEGFAMFDAQSDLAALVYEQGQNPDRILCDFAADLDANGYVPVGLVQLGQGCLEGSLSARLVHTGEEVPLFQDLGACAEGCRLDVDRLLEAGQRIACAIDQGADIVIINRFGRQECEGKGLSHLVAQALEADIPVVIAVPSDRFEGWIKFAEGMSVKLSCDRRALDAWWHGLSARHARSIHQRGQTICEVFK